MTNPRGVRAASLGDLHQGQGLLWRHGNGTPVLNGVREICKDIHAVGRVHCEIFFLVLDGVAGVLPPLTPQALVQILDRQRRGIEPADVEPVLRERQPAAAAVSATAADSASSACEAASGSSRGAVAAAATTASSNTGSS